MSFSLIKQEDSVLKKLNSEAIKLPNTSGRNKTRFVTGDNENIENHKRVKHLELPLALKHFAYPRRTSFAKIFTRFEMVVDMKSKIYAFNILVDFT
ncbi:CLUMA_CG019850, isoform A [Clunio marinus]|uniref:CLUMA_CG019850, isoform A n=1 Tax=Clunio marinus TaxID=568069 RepID=A0A1J1J366_9DIPT|nr:CLUMA_CG019850, isoform A [Clunio marinus]